MQTQILSSSLQKPEHGFQLLCLDTPKKTTTSSDALQS